MRSLFFLIILLSLTACKKKADFDKAQMLKDISNKVLMPKHQELVTTANTLLSKTTAFANTPNQANLQAAQTAWKTTMDAWSVCEIYNFGLIKDRYLFWLIDKTPTSETNITTILQDSSNLIDSTYIASQSAYSKGLPALEYLLFNADANTIISQYTSNPNYERRQILLKELSKNLVQQCSLILNTWAASGENYLATFQSALGDDLQGSISLLSNAMISLTQEIARKKLGKPLGKESSDGLVHTEFIESPYALYSLNIVAKNLEGIQLGFEAMEGLGLDDYLNHLTENEELTTQILAKLTTAQNQITAISTSLKVALDSQTTAIDAIYQELRNLLILLNTDMANNFGITVLPSDNDGD